MYQQYWQLQDQPFDSWAPTKQTCLLPSFQTAAHKLRYNLIDRPGCGVLTGLPGTGKTTLALHMVEENRSRFEHVIWLAHPPFEMLHLLRKIRDGLRPTSPTVVPAQPENSADDLLAEIQTLLSVTQRPCLIVLDDSQTLKNVQSLNVLKSLLEWGRISASPAFEQNRQPAKSVPAPAAPGSGTVSLLLVGHPSFVKDLRANSSSLSQVLSLQITMQPFTLAETEDYLRSCLEGAGSPQFCFDSTAVDSIFRLTGGFPRRINQLADLCLLVGFVQKCLRITDQEVKIAAQELMLPQVA